jgi:lantibiotic modifying enzyme
MTGWCHGAPGIGLARMAGQRLANTEDTDTCITAAMKTTLEAPVSGRDHLCCGNTGRMDILLCHSIKKQDNTLKEIILSMAGQIIERAQRTGRFDLFPPGGEEMFNPGFFLGLSGIGYAFLRLACPAKFPSVLTFD